MDDIRRSIDIRAPIAVVWRFLTETELLANWLMPNTFAPVLGRAFTMDCPPGIGSGAPIDAVVTALEPPAGGRALLAFTWQIDQPLLATHLTIELTETDRYTRLDLVHAGWSDLPEAERGVYDRHVMGWDHLLPNALKPLAEAAIRI